MVIVPNFKPGKRNKYNTSGGSLRGLKYDSKFEAQVRMLLDTHFQNGTLTEIENQKTIELWAEGEHIIDYRCDFRCVHKDGRIIWVEAKGFATPEWRIKRNLMEKVYLKHHPGEEYVIVTKSNFGGSQAFDKYW